MRSLLRMAVLPPTLRPGGPGRRKGDEHERDRSSDPRAPLIFPDHWNEPDVRGALYAAHGRVCGYCGRSLPGNDRGDVDHYRPKNAVLDDPVHGGYWWIAYAFDNYVISCSTCNSNYKSNRFPLRPGARRCDYASRARLHREARLLLDPERDPIEDWLRVEFREPNCPIAPAPGLTRTAVLQVTETLRFFGINSDLRLIKARMDCRDHVLGYLTDGHLSEVRKYAVRYRPHSFVARQMLIDQGLRLPTPGEEIDSLISDLIEELDLGLSILHRIPALAADRGRRSTERNVQEILWSLAYIWKAPPTSKPRKVEQTLRNAGVYDVVKEKYDVL